MTVVSTKEFKSKMDKYLELALNERIFIIFLSSQILQMKTMMITLII